MNNLVISQMSISDLNSISNNLSSDFDDFWNVNILKSELENQISHIIVAKFGTIIVGFAAIWESFDDIHITNIVVHKDYRNRKIGTLLLDNLINLSKQFNKTSITLEVNSKNIIAQKLYLKYGFKILGKRKKYYNGIDDALIMTLYF